MRTLIKIIAVLLVGVIAGFVIYSQWGKPAIDKYSGSDSMLVSDAQAQDQINDEIMAGRTTAITRAVTKVSPAVVSVTVLQVREYIRRSPFKARDPWLREFFPELFQDRKFQQEFKMLGSGFIISGDGYLLTNDHVVEDATKIAVTMLGGKKFDAELVGRDPTLDVALLKIDAEGLIPVIFGNSEEVILGEWAIAVGNPFGLFENNNRPTVTVGVISAFDRDFGDLDGRLYQDMIQTDASINHGNSGGPLANAMGEVVGMNTFIYTGSSGEEGSVGIGFAIPINRIKNLLPELKENKLIDRNFWIGIRVQNLNEPIARKMGYTGTDGVFVSHIDRGSPAEVAGIRLGDIIISIEGKKIVDEMGVRDMVYNSDLKVGDHLKMTVWRDGKTIECDLHLSSIRSGNR